MGHKRYQKEDNLVWWVDLHPDSQKFVQTLYASCDAIKLPDDISYWKKAQKDCDIWKGCQCSIYNGKAYFCENAAALDWLFNDGKNGWNIDDDANPFDKTKEEIDEQARHLCKRCGWCVPEIVPRQFSKDPTYISPSNKTAEGRYSLNVIEPIVTNRWTKNIILDKDNLCKSVSLYRIKKLNEYSDLVNEIDHSLGIEIHFAENKQQALLNGKRNYEWTIILEENQILPKNSLHAILDWIDKESKKDFPRLHFSMPIYEIPHFRFDPDMSEPQ